MAKLPRNMKASETELSQLFDLEEVFGISFEGEERLAQEIGQEMLDGIRTRCEDANKDIFGAKFQSYSPEYIASDKFKDFDKSASDKDMTLTGRMLEDMDFNSSGNSLEIFVTENIGKAYNHQVGDTNPQRAWFGVGPKDMESIKGKFSSDIERVKARRAPPRRSVLDLLTVQTVEAQSAETTFAQLFNDSGLEFEL